MGEIVSEMQSLALDPHVLPAASHFHPGPVLQHCLQEPFVHPPCLSQRPIQIKRRRLYNPATSSGRMGRMSASSAFSSKEGL